MSDTVDRILAETLERAPEERAAYLDRACAGNDALRAEVESLLAADSEAGGFMDVPAVERMRPPRPAEGDSIGRYELRRTLGAGGAGTVYLALQDEPRREVALKVMHAGFGSEDAVRRFRVEAATLARLDHPDIAHVYEAGVADGVPWFAMEYVPESRTLLQFAEPLDRRARLELFARVCDAVHHAHQAGIVHRDLKPANVLVRESGQPKVIDFSIARPAGDAPDFIAGTLPYMSPEHCEAGARVDVRSDVYSLGVVLYELLSGARPYDASSTSIAEARRIIATVAPAPLPGDSGAVAAKALAKDPARRYGSAAALAEDVRRVLDYRPVAARPASWAHHLALFVRRRTALALALGALGCALAAGVAVSLGFAFAAARERDSASRQAYLANIAAASAALRVHDPAEAELRLDLAPAGLRDWEWHYLRGRLDQSRRAIDGLPGVVDATANGGLLAACKTDEVRVWDAASGAVLHGLPARWGYAVALSPDGARLAVADWRKGVALYDALNGDPLVTIEGVGRVADLAFDPTGTRLALAGRDGRAHVCEEQSRSSWRAHAARTICIAFAPDGRVVTGGHGGEVAIWEDGREVARLDAGNASVECIAVHADKLVSGSRDGTVRLWQLGHTAPVATVHAHAGSVTRVAFDATGATFVSASFDRTLGIWAADDARLLARLGGHRSAIMGAELRGDEIVSFARDGTIRYWALRPAARVLDGHRHVVFGLAFGSDGRLAAVDQRGVAVVWDAARREVARVAGDENPFAFGFVGDVLVRARQGRLDLVGRHIRKLEFERPAAIEPGREWLIAAASGGLGAWHVRTGKRVAAWPARDLVAIAAHAARFATANEQRVVSLWSYEHPEPTRSVPLDETPRALCFDAAGKRLAVAAGNRVTVLDAATLEPVATLRGHSGPVHGLAFHPAGTRLATASADTTVRLWDSATGDQVLVLNEPRLGLRCVAFSPDGRRLAAAGGAWDSRSPVWLWELPATLD